MRACAVVLLKHGELGTRVGASKEYAKEMRLRASPRFFKHRLRRGRFFTLVGGYAGGVLGGLFEARSTRTPTVRPRGLRRPRETCFTLNHIIIAWFEHWPLPSCDNDAQRLGAVRNRSDRFRFPQSFWGRGAAPRIQGRQAPALVTPGFWAVLRTPRMTEGCDSVRCDLWDRGPRYPPDRRHVLSLEGKVARAERARRKGRNQQALAPEGSPSQSSRHCVTTALPHGRARN